MVVVGGVGNDKALCIYHEDNSVGGIAVSSFMFEGLEKSQKSIVIRQPMASRHMACAEPAASALGDSANAFWVSRRKVSRVGACPTLLHRG